MEKPSETIRLEIENSKNTHTLMNLEAQWVVGFIDGEGCFYVGCLKRRDMAVGYQVQPELIVVQHQIDIQVLHGLKAFFKCGSVTRNNEDRWCWRVKNLEHFLTIIIPFFEKHHLKTKRRQEFEVFRDICLRMKRKEHLNHEGFNKIQALADSLRVQTADQKVRKELAKSKKKQQKDSFQNNVISTSDNLSNSENSENL